jgi:uncharacterized protein YndB with AHSA1/START domain
MSAKDFTLTLHTNQSPETVFNAICNVRGWWSETLEGASAQEGDEFVYRFKDIHYSKQRLVEVIPNQKMVWQVLDSYLSFVEDHEEWNGSTVQFDITSEGDQTQLVFTHHGLNPQQACFEACKGGWTFFIEQSLQALIDTGKGQPNMAEASTAKS